MSRSLDSGVWCCEREHQCKWQCFALHRGLAWGTIPNEHNVWRQWHDRECGGQLIQLLEPFDTSSPTAREDMSRE